MKQRNSHRKLFLTSLLLLTTSYSGSLLAANCAAGWAPSGSVFSGCVYGNQNGTVWAQQVTASFASIQAAIDYYKDANLETYFPGLDFNKAGLVLHGVIDMSGFGLGADYITSAIATISLSGNGGVKTGADGISKVLTLSYTDASGNAVSHTFDQQVGGAVPQPGETTQAIEDQLKDFVKGGTGQNFLTGMLQARVAKSPIDPVAGNPVSYMARLVDNDYDLAIEGHAAGENDGGLTLFGMTPQYSRDTLAGLNVSSYDLPLRYNHFFNNSNNLIIDMPITMQTLNQTNTYSAGLGVAYSHFFLPHWSLMPAFHVGAVGSLDLGSATLLYDGALASRVTFPVGPNGQYEIGMTNDVSYLKTQSVTIASYSIAYKLSNWLTKNGTDFNYIINKSYSVGTYFDRVDKLSGNPWYVADYNEIGVKTAKIAVYNGARYNFLTLGLGYLFGPSNFSGVNMSLGINF
ncbi:MAG: hypothetical protein EXR81_03600 [Gammaproteobacteria bacterium]|nr:hypothetical protein [Gammaproteobacteria bacterium]